MASRLFQDLRESRGLVYLVEAYGELYQDDGRVCVSAGCGAAAAVEVAHSVAAHLIAMAEHGPTAAELARAARILEASMMMAAESPAARCEAAVSQTLLYGAPLPLSAISARIRAVTVEDVTRVARAAVAAARQGQAAASAIGPEKGLAAAQVFTASFG